jgi:hypothetical protein
MAFQAREKFTSVGENSSRSMEGCHDYLLINQGNTYVTVNGNLVLEPGTAWGTDNANPEIKYFTDLTFIFDEASPQAHYSVKPGSNPTDRNAPVYDSGRPEAKINKVIIIQTFLTNG